MTKLQYIEGKEELLEELGFLWEMLNEHHGANSKYFSERFEQFRFADRKTSLKEKGCKGDIKVILVKDLSVNVLIGYVISTVDEHNIGEIESIYIESDYRKYGIGNKLIETSMEWLKSKNVKKTIIGVAEGNEDAYAFYARHGFYPKVSILEKP